MINILEGSPLLVSFVSDGERFMILNFKKFTVIFENVHLNNRYELF